MTGKPLPTWPLPVLALLQVYVGTVLTWPLMVLGSPWSVEVTAFSALVSIGGLAIMALAVRNCVRLWQVQPGEASWELVAAMIPVTVFSALWATGPMTIGIWRWSSLVPGAFAAYLIVVLAREVRRRLVLGTNTGEPVAPQHSP